MAVVDFRQRAPEDGLIGLVDGVTDPLRDLFVRLAGGAGHFLANDGHRHLTGDFTRRMASHTVGDDKEALIGPHEKVVLVAGANDTHIRPAGDSEGDGLAQRYAGPSPRGLGGGILMA